MSVLYVSVSNTSTHETTLQKQRGHTRLGKQHKNDGTRTFAFYFLLCAAACGVLDELTRAV